MLFAKGEFGPALRSGGAKRQTKAAKPPQGRANSEPRSIAAASFAGRGPQNIKKKVMWRVLIYCSCFFLLFSCYRPLETETPLLSEEEMIPFLVDIHLAEAKIADYNSLTVLSRDSLAAEQYATVFQIHQMDPVKFQQSMQAYMGNPAALESLYEKVVEALLAHELRYSGQSKKKKKSSPAAALDKAQNSADSSKKEN